MYRSGIVGTGSAQPKKILTNHDLELIVDTSDEWITTRTGIKERRIAEDHEYLSPFCIEASQQALEMAGMSAEDVDLIVCATVTPDQVTPATGSFIQVGLKANRAFAFDLSAGCSGFIYALSVADQYIKSGTIKTALVIGGEILSKYINWKDRGTCIIFADGAGAVLLTRVGESRGILSTCLRSDGKMADYIS
ncbi:beta-ketoacyl-ACP synthase 3, partial [Acidobacteriota bacterium]